jgi:transposase-like protein
MIQRDGEVVIRMPENVQTMTIEPLIRATISSGSLVYADEYGIYNRNGAMGTRQFVMVQGNMHEMRMEIVFAKSMSI